MTESVWQTPCRALMDDDRHDSPRVPLVPLPVPERPVSLCLPVQRNLTRMACHQVAEEGLSLKHLYAARAYVRLGVIGEGAS